MQDSRPKNAILISLGIVALLTASATLSLFNQSQTKTISIENLATRLENKDTFILQIELEGCPACKLLDKTARASAAYKAREPLVVHIPSDKKEEARTELHLLIPQFEFYPSIFLISNGNALSEFDLSTIDDFDSRYETWTAQQENHRRK